MSKIENSAICTTDVLNENNLKYGTDGGNDTKDKVFLLSIDEATNEAYGFRCQWDGHWGTLYYVYETKKSKTRVAKNTTYVAGGGASGAESNNMSGAGRADCWWLRSCGYGNKRAAFVGREGSVSAHGGEVNSAFYHGRIVYYYPYAVRPALHMKLSSASVWSPAGYVTSNGKESVKVSAKKTTMSVKKVSFLKLKQKNHTVTISWNRVYRATGYQICYSTSKKWKNKKLKVTQKNKLTIKKLKKNKIYYFRVRAYQMKGTSKVYGSWSKTKKITIKK